MAESLPLFPLGTVLLPGAVLPLHIFEPRYRALVRDLLALPEGSGRSFGVVAITAGHEVGEAAATALADVGCVAELRAVSPHEDGRFDVVAVGTTRFRLLGVEPAAGTPYLTGRVERLGEPLAADDSGDAARARRVVDLVGKVSASLRRYLTLVQGEEAAGEALPGEPAALSYVVAAQLLLDRSDRQRLLAAPDTVSRLRLELALLRREQVLLGALGAVPATDLFARRLGG